VNAPEKKWLIGVKTSLRGFRGSTPGTSDARIERDKSSRRRDARIVERNAPFAARLRNLRQKVEPVTAVLLAILAAIGFSGASLAALLGRELGPRSRSYSVAFAAGILLALAFVDLFPESLEIARVPAIAGFVGGFTFLFLTEAFTSAHTHHSVDEPVRKHALGPFVLGLTIHNFADGFVLGVGAREGAVVSGLVGLGILVHQMPVGISLAAVLMAAHATRAQVARATIVPGTAIPLATVLTLALPIPGAQALALLTGIAGGVLAYIGAAHLLPEAQAEHPSRITGLLFAATLIVMTIGLVFLPGD
jgi:ZIP family zinc transporter